MIGHEEDTRRRVENEEAFMVPYLQEGLRVLDAGCGPGTISVGIAKLVAPSGSVVAMDIDPISLKNAEKYANDESVKNIEFREGSILNIPFPDESFDVVWTHAVLCHTWSKRSQIFSEIYRVLKKDGIYAVRDVDSSICYPEYPILTKYFEYVNETIKKNGGDMSNTARKIPVEGIKVGLKLEYIGFRAQREQQRFSLMKKIHETGLRGMDDKEKKEEFLKQLGEIEEKLQAPEQVQMALWGEIIFRK